ncbi:MAG TPA: Crp/Fnr family transcriptional regulator [Stellaceae bacterium]|nr:Crp/Fnr family transcriptional regulator [Stellaceae bacterium]
MAEESEASGPAASLSLAGVKILATVPASECTYLETHCTYRRIAAGDVLMARFSSGTAVYFILAGRARIVHHIGESDEVTIAIVGAGDALGEISAIDGGAASATIIADEDCVVAELPKQEFQALLVRRGEVALAMAKRWASIIRDLDDKVSFVSSIGPEQRICSEIIRLARVTQPGSDQWLVPELPSHQELAIRAQTTRESVARVIAELASRGVVERRTRALYILNFQALKDVVRRGVTLNLSGDEAGSG